MDDLISRAAALDAIDNERKLLIEQGRFGAEHILVHHARRVIEDLPAVDAVPVVNGRWVRQNGSAHVFKCSACGFKFAGAEIAKYCLNCGAKMDGERRDDEGADAGRMDSHS